MLLEVDVVRILEVSNIEVDRIVDVLAGDMDVASRIGVRSPIRHRDILGVVGKHGMIAIVCEIEGDDHQWAVGSVLEVLVPRFAELRAEGIDGFFGWAELASYEVMSEYCVRAGHEKSGTHKHP